MDIYEIMATIAGVIIVVAGMPQIVKIAKNKEAKDVSLEMFVLFLIGQIIWLSYGIHLSNKPLVISNIGALIVSSTNIFLILKYRGNKIK